MILKLTKRNSPAALHPYLDEINALLAIYIRVMTLKRNRKDMSRKELIQAFIYVAYGYLKDIGFNWWTGTKIFKDLPREFTFTARLNRYRAKTSWRMGIAEFICDSVLDSHDPDGNHC